MSVIREKIIYLANIRLPTEKAHGIQVAKMCEALAEQGLEVELMAPNRLNSIKDDVFNYYGIKKNFILNKLPCIDLISRAAWLGRIAYWVEALSFAWSVKKHLKDFSGSIYTRELGNIAFLGPNNRIMYEAHNLPKRPNALYRHWLKKINNLAVITRGLKDDFIALGFSAERILVAPDAVDLKVFSISDSKIYCRKRLNLPLNRRIVLYAGHLYDWKGADTLLGAAKLLPECLLIFVGGTNVDVANFRKKAQSNQAENGLIVGHRPAGEIPAYLCAADVLVLPNSAKSTISARYTSPLKLFEYMASRRPIIASDLPSLREILTEEIAIFFKPDDSQSLAEGIKSSFDNPAVAAKKAETAYLKAQNYTWDKRAEEIINFLKIVN